MQPQSTAQQQTTTDTAQQRWYFTFGSGQQHDGKYVVIPGTYDEARDVMLAHFGNAWSFQYASAERAGVEEFGLVELPRAEWPQPATITAPTGPAGFPGFTPGEDRRLLADVHRWARTNGWTWHECWGWINAPYASEATLAVEWDNERPGVLTISSGPVVLRAKHYDVDSVRQAVDQLVTLGILPDRFATSYGLGVAAGLDTAAELAGGAR